jgi:hypothetical protein
MSHDESTGNDTILFNEKQTNADACRKTKRWIRTICLCLVAIIVIIACLRSFFFHDYIRINGKRTSKKREKKGLTLSLRLRYHFDE